MFETPAVIGKLEHCKYTGAITYDNVQDMARQGEQRTKSNFATITVHADMELCYCVNLM